MWYSIEKQGSFNSQFKPRQMLIEKRKGNVFNVMWYEDDRCRGELFALEERAAMEFIEKALISANVTWSESEQPIAAQEDGPPFYLPTVSYTHLTLPTKRIV